MVDAAETKLAEALRAIGLSAELGARLAVGGERGAPAPRLPVEEVGVACVGAALLAAARLHEAGTGEWLAPSLDRGAVRAALVSERLFRVAGEPAGAGFAPASRFWRAADGWVRTHANYPWHREALLAAVGVGDGAARGSGRDLGPADLDALAAAIAARPAAAVEAATFSAGGIAAAVRTPAEWSAHPQGAAVAAEPLVASLRLGDAEPRPAVGGSSGRQPDRAAPRRSSDAAPAGSSGAAPAAGVRVLDFTRVIAGPVCSRYLGALGAEVLRLDTPELPDLEPGRPADTLLGKRSAFLDLRFVAARRRLVALLADADVVLLGHRPGALARFGLSPEELAARHPGLVVMELAAWGHTGPWAGRRGFDSIVQAASGIAALEADPAGDPGALPCQLLDHGTGYLAAAAILAALADQRREGGTHIRRLSLARTAAWLLAEPPAPGPPGRPAWHETGASFAVPLEDDPSLTAVPPPGALDGVPLRWRGRGGRYGGAEPGWGD
jgi:crotonobetainyl-CoA:carnitine CoA-transferase CaiB-like acyl-CoA transferase